MRSRVVTPEEQESSEPLVRTAHVAGTATETTKVLPKIVSLFSGAGGLDLGFKRAGFPLTFLVMMIICVATGIVTSRAKRVSEMEREAEWISGNAGRSVPLHLSRYFPTYRRTTPATPPETILRLREIAEKYLDFVYTGNMPGEEGGSDTRCPDCHTTVIRRSGYYARISGLTDEGSCVKCSRQIIAASDV